MSLPEEQIGQYEVLAHLARGGMADVYLARTTGLEGFERICVLKRVRPLARDREQFLDMFLDEARIAAMLQHANIVQVYDVQKDPEGLYYMAMEYLHGQDLSRVLRRAWAAQEAGAEGVPLEQAVTIISAVCAGLHYAHERKDREGNPLGVVHRDVSPQNVFVTYEGQVKIVDFGIAKAQHRIVETKVGAVKGKMGYMAPEQATGAAVDRRADVFALGILSWELTVGRRLFGEGNDYEKMRRIVKEDAPHPSTIVADFPAPLEGIIMRCLRRDLESRYANLGEVRRDLEAFARGQGMTLSTLGVAEMMTRLFPGKLELEQIVRGAMAGDTKTALIGIPSSLTSHANLGGTPSDGAPTSQERLRRFSDSADSQPSPGRPPGALLSDDDLPPTRITGTDPEADTRTVAGPEPLAEPEDVEESIVAIISDESSELDERRDAATATVQDVELPGHRRWSWVGVVALVTLVLAFVGIVWLQVRRPEVLDLVRLLPEQDSRGAATSRSETVARQPSAAPASPRAAEHAPEEGTTDEAYDENLDQLTRAAKRIARKRKAKLKERMRMRRLGLSPGGDDGLDDGVEDEDLSIDSIVEDVADGGSKSKEKSNNSPKPPAPGKPPAPTEGHSPEKGTKSP